MLLEEDFSFLTKCPTANSNRTFVDTLIELSLCFVMRFFVEWSPDLQNYQNDLNNQVKKRFFI